jgi:hypothetical protein
MTRGELPSAAKPDWFLVALCIAGALYVAFALTPSSYEIVLAQMGAPGNGLRLGEARWLRADEWAIWTPSFQAAVNNGFDRVNETSLYREDLRNFWGLPLADWSIVFKPYFWPFFVAPPAIALSFYHAFFIVAFVLGYRKLFHELGASRAVAGLVSIALLCTNHVQGFWTTYNTIFAGFPWIILAAVSRLRPWTKCSITAYLASSWMLAHLYPTLMIPLAFVGAITVAVVRPRSLSLRAVLAVATGLSIAALVVHAYLRDVIPVMANTSYPGQRVSGGGGIPHVLWLSQLLPFFTTDDYESFVGPEDWFYLAVGSYLPLLVLAFVDWGRFFERLRRADDSARLVRRGCIGFGTGLALTSAWMLLPLPPALGVPLLWHKSLPDRMLFPCGLMWIMLASIVLAAAPLRVGWGRVLGASSVIAGGWLVSRWFVGSLPVWSGWRHLIVPATLGAVAFAAQKLPGRERVLLVGWAAAANVVAFGAYNGRADLPPPRDRADGRARPLGRPSRERLARDRRGLWRGPERLGLRFGQARAAGATARLLPGRAPGPAGGRAAACVQSLPPRAPDASRPSDARRHRGQCRRPVPRLPAGVGSGRDPPEPGGTSTGRRRGQPADAALRAGETASRRDRLGSGGPERDRHPSDRGDVAAGARRGGVSRRRAEVAPGASAAVELRDRSRGRPVVGPGPGVDLRRLRRSRPRSAPAGHPLRELRAAEARRTGAVAGTEGAEMYQLRRRRQAAVLRVFRTVHRTTGALLFVFFTVVACTGLLLGWKKHSAGVILPKSHQGSSLNQQDWLPIHVLHENAIRIARSKISPDLSLELERIDIRPDKGMVKFVFVEGYWGVQLDCTTGDLLHIERRRSDLIENIHDGSFLDYLFETDHEQVKLGYTSVMGLALLTFTTTGFWLWYGPRRIRAAARRRRGASLHY